METVDRVKTAKAVRDLKDAYSKELDAINEDGSDAHNLIPFYGSIREAKDLLEEDMQRFTGLHDHVKYKALPDAFDAEDIRTLTTAAGDRVTITIDTLASVLKEDRPKTHQWLRQNGYGDLITEMVHPGTLSAFTRTWMEEKGKDLPTDAHIKVDFRPKANFTKGKKKA